MSANLTSHPWWLKTIISELYKTFSGSQALQFFNYYGLWEMNGNNGTGWWDKSKSWKRETSTNKIYWSGSTGTPKIVLEPAQPWDTTQHILRLSIEESTQKNSSSGDLSKSLTVKWDQDYPHLFCLLDETTGSGWTNGRLFWKDPSEKHSKGIEYLGLLDTRLMKLGTTRAAVSVLLLKNLIEDSSSNEVDFSGWTEKSVSSKGNFLFQSSSLSSSYILLWDSECPGKYGQGRLNSKMSEDWNLETKLFWIFLKLLKLYKFRSFILGCSPSSLSSNSIKWLDFSSLSSSNECKNSTEWYAGSADLKQKSGNGVNDRWSESGLSGARIKLSSSGSTWTLEDYKIYELLS